MNISGEQAIGLTEYVYPEIMQQLAELNEMAEQIDVINSTSRSVGAGSESSSYQDVYYGFNRLPKIPYLPAYTESQGLVLFTKPELNLSYNNISGVRKLSVLCEDAEVNSVAHLVKCALDPITAKYLANRTSKLIDPLNPYITYFSNLCLTMNQPPDIGIDTFTSAEGMMREQWMNMDGVVDVNGYYDITCTMANIPGNPIPLTLYAWLYYMHHQRFGPCVPHPENRISGRMDYFTRIERFTFDPTGRFIQQWWHCGAALPKNLSLGSFFSLNKLEPNNKDNVTTTVQFGCVGSIYNDPIQLAEFNIRMMRWNPNLVDGKREKMYIKIHPSDRGITNGYGYPLINLDTREMEWWISKEDLTELLKGQRVDAEKTTHSVEIAKYNNIRGRYLPYQL